MRGCKEKYEQIIVLEAYKLALHESWAKYLCSARVAPDDSNTGAI